MAQTRHASLAIEAVILGVFAIGSALTATIRDAWEAQALIALSAMAMGIQSAAVRRLDVPGIATTYVTGTLTSAVTGLVARSGSGASRAASTQSVPSSGFWWRRVRLQVLALFLYGFEALIAGLVHAHWPMFVAALPVIAVVAVAVAAPTRPAAPAKG